MNDLPFLILFLLAVAFLVRIDFIFYVAYVCIGIYAWGRWVTPRLIRQIRLRRTFRDHAFLGEPVSVNLHIWNPGRLPVPWVQIIESTPVQLSIGAPIRNVLALSAGESRELRYQVKAMRRGYYRLGPLLVGGGDLFGFRETRSQIASDTLTVYPQILPMTQLGLPSRLPHGVLPSRQRLFEDPARPIGIRSYRPGDSLKRINWKVSAHSGALLVKTLEPAISLETFILLNLNGSDYHRGYRYDGPEWAVVVAASLAAHVAHLRQAVGLGTNGVDPLLQTQARSDRAFDESTGRLRLNLEVGQGNGDEEREVWAATLVPSPISPRTGRAHLMKILERLARVEAGATIPFDEWMSQACIDLGWGATILAITPVADLGTCRALHRLMRRGFNPLLLITDPHTSFSKIKERAHHLGFAAFRVLGRQELESMQQRSIVY